MNKIHIINVLCIPYIMSLIIILLLNVVLIRFPFTKMKCRICRTSWEIDAIVLQLSIVFGLVYSGAAKYMAIVL